MSCVFYPVMFTFVVVRRPGPAVSYVKAVVCVFTFFNVLFLELKKKKKKAEYKLSW